MLDILVPHLAEEARLVLVRDAAPPRSRLLVGGALLRVEAIEVRAAELKGVENVNMKWEG